MYTPEQFGGRPGVDSTEALQGAFEAAARDGGAVYLSPGTWLGNVDIRNVRGLKVWASSPMSTTLQGIRPGAPALRIRGFWYSSICDLGFAVREGLRDGAVVEIDSGPERGVQANSFERLIINGQGLGDGKRSKYAMSMCRTGTNSAQGSEQTFYRCHFSGASQACYYQEGYNALTNSIFGGNFQGYDRCGIELVFGSLQIANVGFQSTNGYEQVENGGWDIKADSGGVGDVLTITGCRTESLRFFKGNHAQPAHLVGCLQAQNAAYDPARPFNVVEVPAGIIENCIWHHGQVSHEHDYGNPGKEIVEDYTTTPRDRWVLAHCLKPITVTLCDPASVPHGYTVKVTRTGTSKSKLTVAALYLNDSPGTHRTSITKSAEFVAYGGRYATRRWYRVK